ncbi:MAG: ComEC/Rec2 family competence protein, partial [Planctomycetota bacterium]
MPPPLIEWTPWQRERLDSRRRTARRAPYQPLVPVAAAFAIGVVIDRGNGPSAGVGLAAALVSLVALLLWLTLRRRASEFVAAALLLVAVAGSGAAWHHAHWRLYDANELGRFADRRSTPVCVEAVTVSAPAIQSTGRPNPFRAIPQVEATRVSLRAVRLRDGDNWLAVSGAFDLIVDGHLVGIEPGDRLRVFGQLSRAPIATNPGQHDAALHHRADRRLCRVRAESPDCIDVLERGVTLSPRRWLSRIRRSAIAALDRELPPDTAALSAAMLLGARDRVPPDVAERFRRTGSLHVLVVSGLHVGLVLAGLFFATRMGWLPRRWAIVAMMLLAVAYGMLAGGRPPVLRAVVLAEVLCLALLLGRRVLAFNSLAAAGLAVMLINPSEFFRSGTQLSFLATGALIWFGRRQLERPEPDPLDRLIASVQPWWRRGTVSIARAAALVVAATLVVWLVSAPLLLHRFHLLSPIAVVLSVGVFPLVAVAVAGGMTLLAASLFAPWAAAPAAVVTRFAIESLDGLLEAGDRLPGSSLWAPAPAGWWVIGVYALLFAAAWLGHSARARTLLLRAALLWLPTAFLPWA